MEGPDRLVLGSMGLGSAIRDAGADPGTDRSIHGILGSLQGKYAPQANCRRCSLADLLIPMVAPDDVGALAAVRLKSGVEDGGIRYVEGPERYSSTDVAQAFADVLGCAVEVEVTPREEWENAFSNSASPMRQRTPMLG